MRMTVYEAFCFCEIDRINVIDDESDYTTSLYCNMKKNANKTAHERLMWFFCTNIEICNYRPNGFSTAFLTEFIERFSTPFLTFAKEKKLFDASGKPSLHMAFDNFVNNIYSNEDCERLLELLKTK